MTPEDKPNFVALITNIAELYSKTISTVTLDIYWKVLARYPLDTVKQALQAHLVDIERGRFMPFVADIMAQIEHPDRALLAWSKVYAAIARIGIYESIVFDDPVIHVVISDMGGWIALCKHESTQLVFYQREFERRYRFALRNPFPLYPRELAGILAHNNDRFDASPRPARLYGDQSKALQVYQEGVDGRAFVQRLIGALDIQQLIQNSAQLTQPQSINIFNSTLESIHEKELVKNNNPETDIVTQEKNAAAKKT